MAIIYLDPTGRCNLRCAHCYAAGNRRWHLDGDTVLQIVRQLPPSVEIGLIGGEPLMHEDIVGIVSCCAQEGHRTTLVTNATLVTPHIARKLADAGISAVACSLDGPTGSIHNALRGPNSFERCVDGIRALNDVLAGDDSLAIGITVHTGNCGLVEETLGFVDRLEVFARVTLERTVAMGAAAENRWLVPDDCQWVDACEQACRSWRRWLRLSTLTVLGLPLFVRTLSRRFKVCLNNSVYSCPVVAGDIYGRIYADGRLFSCGRREILEEAARKGILPDEGQHALQVLATSPGQQHAYPSSAAKIRAHVAHPVYPICTTCPDREICTNCPVATLLGYNPDPTVCALIRNRYQDHLSESLRHAQTPGGTGDTQARLSRNTYAKDLRSGSKLVFVPGQDQSLRLAGKPKKVWEEIVSGVPVEDIRRMHPSIPLADGLHLDTDGFLTVLQRFGAVEDSVS